MVTSYVITCTYKRKLHEEVLPKTFGVIPEEDLATGLVNDLNAAITTRGMIHDTNLENVVYAVTTLDRAPMVLASNHYDMVAEAAWQFIQPSLKA